MTSAGETGPSISDARLLRDRVSTLYATGWLMTAGNIVAALLVLIMVGDVAPFGLVIVWPAALAALTLLRGALFWFYREAASGPHSPRLWGALYTLCSIALGLCWGLALGYLALVAPPHALALMIGVATVTVIAGASNAVYPWAYPGYSLALTIPLVAALLLRGDDTGRELAAFSALIALIGLLIGRRLGEIMLITESSRFFSRLVETAAAYSRQMAEAVTPGLPAPPPLPPLDTTDTNAWFRQLTEYGNDLSTHIATSYKTFLDRVAAGEVDSGGLKDAASEYLERRFPEYLRQLGRLYFDLLSDLNDLRFAGEQDFLSGLLASDNAAPAPSLALTLTGPSNQRVSATLSIANTREATTRVRHRVGEVRRADGVGPGFAPKLSVTPEHLDLQPSEEGTLTVTLSLEDSDYAPDTLYIGVLHVASHGEPQLDIPLRIIANSTSNEPPPS